MPGRVGCGLSTLRSLAQYAGAPSDFGQPWRPLSIAVRSSRSSDGAPSHPTTRLPSHLATQLPDSVVQPFPYPGGNLRGEQLDASHQPVVRQGAVAVFEIES